MERWLGGILSGSTDLLDPNLWFAEIHSLIIDWLEQNHIGPIINPRLVNATKDIDAQNVNSGLEWMT